MASGIPNTLVHKPVPDVRASVFTLALADPKSAWGITVARQMAALVEIRHLDSPFAWAHQTLKTNGRASSPQPVGTAIEIATPADLVPAASAISLFRERDTGVPILVLGDRWLATYWLELLACGAAAVCLRPQQFGSVIRRLGLAVL